MCWICNIKEKDEVSSKSLLTKLGIQDINVALNGTSRMGWLGHIEPSTCWITQALKLEVSQQANANLTCLEVVRKDQVKFSTDSIDPQNCSEWAS